MEKVIKLTRPDRTTRGGFFYEPDREYTFKGHGQLCSSSYAHAYWTAELAVLYNPIHASYDPFVLFEATGCVELDDGTKLGLTSIIVPVSPLESVPVFTMEQRVAWGIVNTWPFGRSEWRTWARGWLTGKKDRGAGAVAGGAGVVEWAAWAAWGAARAAVGEAASGKAIAFYQHALARWVVQQTTNRWEPETWPTFP